MKTSVKKKKTLQNERNKIPKRHKNQQRNTENMKKEGKMTPYKEHNEYNNMLILVCGKGKANEIPEN